MIRIVDYEDLPDADLVVDAVYQGQRGGKLSGEAISRLLPGVGNQGGFRGLGRGIDKKLVVLYTSGADRDWPDSLDLETGRFTYYGDNKRPGYELHATQRQGNLILRRVFDLLHRDPPERELIPPFLIFKKYPTSVSARSFQFKGLAVPGFMGLPPTNDLVAVWKSTAGQRFQNYSAVFTVLKIARVSRSWLEDLSNGRTVSVHEPEDWRRWVDSGTYNPLTAQSNTVIRTTENQIPANSAKMSILNTVWQHFDGHSKEFERFSARLFQMHDPRVTIDEITRPSLDGGRDAVGRYLLGLHEDPIYAEFSLEAKCYRPPGDGREPNAVGVKEVSRLISRIRFRQFGVMVTTSVVGRRAYEEVREDQHPIVFISGKDIVEILIASGFNTPKSVQSMLEREFPVIRLH